MSNESTSVSPRRSRRFPAVLGLVAGVALGAALSGILVYLLMPGMMITVHESRFDSVEETCEKLKESIEANGWICPAVRDMNKSMAKHGVVFDRPLRIVELCRAEYAKDVLTTNTELLTLMPCALAVYEGEDGKVYISGMNTGLMGKMFGGNVADVMGRKVSREEEEILRNVVL